MMTAEVKSFYCTEIDDLSNWIPDDPTCFSICLRAIVGPHGSEGEESFDFIVCTPEWLRVEYDDDDVIFARHHVIVFRYDFDRIRSRIEGLVRRTGGESWREVAEKIGRYGQWEFEDYQERNEVSST